MATSTYPSTPSPFSPLIGSEKAASLPIPIIVGDSLAMRRLRTQVKRLGPHFRAVLLRGEPGTGKKLVARALHGFSAHASGQFVTFPETAMPPLGEMTRLLKQAHRGTLYVNHIDTSGEESQAELLTGLRSAERRRRGPIMVHGLEARIVASTAVDLHALLASRQFSNELYFRIATVEIELPPLRDRIEDVPALAEFFAGIYSRTFDRQVQGLSTSAVDRMRAYRWPGNIDELKNLMRRAVLQSTGTTIEADDLTIPETGLSRSAAVEPDGPVRLNEVVEHHVFQVLRACAGNKVRAAELLGISRSTLYRMIDAGVTTGKL